MQHQVRIMGGCIEFLKVDTSQKPYNSEDLRIGVLYILSCKIKDIPIHSLVFICRANSPLTSYYVYFRIEISSSIKRTGVRIRICAISIMNSTSYASIHANHRKTHILDRHELRNINQTLRTPSLQIDQAR